MTLLGNLHAARVYPRRIRRLSELLAEVVPPHCSLLDIGCGDGKLARSLLDRRADLRIEGVDVLIRDRLWLSVQQFDGKSLPHADCSFDGVMLIDVLHHTPDPIALLQEGMRVGRRWVIIKDHVLNGRGAAWRLRFMDYVGNSRHGVALPYNYLSATDWDQFRRSLGLTIAREIMDLELYPKPFDYIFGADLHFMAVWESVARSA